MSNMVVEWQGIEFVVQEYRDSGTYILCSINDIQTLLDDHIIKTQTMKNSPYIKPFETEILWVVLTANWNYWNRMANDCYHFAGRGNQSSCCYKTYWTIGYVCKRHGSTWNPFSLVRTFSSRCRKRVVDSARSTKFGKISWSRCMAIQRSCRLWKLTKCRRSWRRHSIYWKSFRRVWTQ